MVITNEEEYEVALERLEQMFGKLADEDDDREFETLLQALEAWEEKMRSH